MVKHKLILGQIWTEARDKLITLYRGQLKTPTFSRIRNRMEIHLHDHLWEKIAQHLINELEKKRL